MSDSYRDAAEIRWLVFAPGDEAAADALAARCAATMEEEWGVARAYADGSLPAPGVYGIPDVWPHVAAALERAGFAPGDRVEAVLVADVWELDVDEGLRRRGIGTWRVGHGADSLRLARADRLLDYVVLGEGDAHLAFATALGFRELTRTRRGWERP